MNIFKEMYSADLDRYEGKPDAYLKKFHFYFRKCQSTENPFFLQYTVFCLKRLRKNMGLNYIIKRK